MFLNIVLFALFLSLPIIQTEAQQEPAKTRASEVRDGPGFIGRRAQEPQLRVHSKHPFFATKFENFSREVRIQFRSRLGLFKDEGWTSKMLILVYGTGDDVFSGVDIQHHGEMDAGLNFTIWMNVRLHDRFDTDNFRIELIRMLLRDQMLNVYHDSPELYQDKEIQPPDWLLYGIEYSLRHRELGRPSYFYSGFLKNGQLMNVEDVVKPDQVQGLTPLSMELFRASSAILVDALCDQKQGGQSMRALLGDIVKDPDADCLNLILKHFPAFRETGQGVDKWWALQLATMSQQQSFEFFSPAETQYHLNQALAVHIPEQKVLPVKRKNKLSAAKAKVGFLDRLKKRNQDNTKNVAAPIPEAEPVVIPAFNGSLHDYRRFSAHKDFKSIVANRFTSLAALKVKAFPAYHDVIDRYIITCRGLTQGKLEGIDREFAELKKMRNQIDTTLNHCQDYLNYYQATQSPKRSQAFDNYIKFKTDLRSQNANRIDDPLSNYMNEVERHFLNQK